MTSSIATFILMSNLQSSMDIHPNHFHHRRGRCLLSPLAGASSSLSTLYHRVALQRRHQLLLNLHQLLSQLLLLQIVPMLRQSLLLP